MSINELVTIDGQDILFNDQALQMIDVINLAKEYEETLKLEIQKSMEIAEITSTSNDHVDAKFKSGTIRNSFDSKSFKQAQPELYVQFLKESIVKDSYTIKFKDYRKGKTNE